MDHAAFLRTLPLFAGSITGDFLIEHGRFYGMGPMTRASSAALRLAIRRATSIGYRPRLRFCFANCAAIVEADQTGRIAYCEGFALGYFPVQHAWLEVDGVVVDPTWTADGGLRPGPATYFGVRLKRDSVVRKFRSGREVISLLGDWTLRHPVETAGIADLDV